MENYYLLLDSGNGQKLEQFGSFTLIRPCAQAVWNPVNPEAWKNADAIFTREGNNKWLNKNRLPSIWEIRVANILFKIETTDFGHLGIFPEQQLFWQWIQEKISSQSNPEKIQVLNLFAYSGGSTLAAAKAGAQVCHLDASKGMVAWARENAQKNGLNNAPIRWIVDDATKFLQRELKRENFYDAIILDPPTFGRGAKGEVFKIEEDIIPLLNLCKSLLKEKPLFILFSCHTPGFSNLVMHHLLSQVTKDLRGSIDYGEMIIPSNTSFSLPSGTFARWQSG